MSQPRTLFVESPYVAVLYEACLKTRCSSCFAPATMLCSQCKSVVYCNSRCFSRDWPLHQIECSNLPEMQLFDHRCIARFGMRRYLDGGVASLCSGFPKTVKDRTCNDLVSHYDDFVKAGYFSNWDNFWNECKRYFANTPLSQLKTSDALRLICIFNINSCGILEGGTIDERRSPVTIGVALYLNFSRFDNGCRPDLAVEFVGNRMTILEMNPRGDESKVWTEDEFNRLTFDYGVRIDGCAIPLISQRIESLKSRFFFECSCVRCADPVAKAVEERASTYECRRCKKPYVWPRRSNKLQPTCRCESNPLIEFGATQAREVEELDARWNKLRNFIQVSYSIGQFAVEHVVKEIESLKNLVSKCWHPVMNLRYGQMHEELSIAYRLRASIQTTRDRRIEDVELAALAGESMIPPYEQIARDMPRLNWAMAIRVYYYVATLYGHLYGLENVKKARHWYTKSAKMCRADGDDENESIVLRKIASLDE